MMAHGQHKRMGGKHCPDCRQFKVWAAFSLDGRERDGHTRRCKKCKKAYDHEHYLSTREERRKQIEAWEAAHPDHKAERQERRRKRLRENGGSHTWDQWVALCDRYEWHCLRCGGQGGTDYLTRDHVIPVSLGGANDIANIQPLCQSCNQIKGKDSTDYRPRWGRVGAHAQEMAADD